MLSSNTAIAEVFSRTDHKFDLLFAKRSFLHWFNQEEDVLTQARENISSLEFDYEPTGINDVVDSEEE